MKIEFKVLAKKYFEMDADRLQECKDTEDYCIVLIDTEEKTAEYCWVPENADNAGNYNYEPDFFDAVMEFWEEVKDTDQVWDIEIEEE